LKISVSGKLIRHWAYPLGLVRREFFLPDKQGGAVMTNEEMKVSYGAYKYDLETFQRFVYPKIKEEYYSSEFRKKIIFGCLSVFSFILAILFCLLIFGEISKGLVALGGVIIGCVFYYFSKECEPQKFATFIFYPSGLIDFKLNKYTDKEIKNWGRCLVAEVRLDGGKQEYANLRYVFAYQNSWEIVRPGGVLFKAKAWNVVQSFQSFEFSLIGCDGRKIFEKVWFEYLVKILQIYFVYNDKENNGFEYWVTLSALQYICFEKLPEWMVLTAEKEETEESVEEEKVRSAEELKKLQIEIYSEFVAKLEATKRAIKSDQIRGIRDEYVRRLMELKNSLVDSTENTIITAVIAEGNDKGREIRFDLGERLKYWTKFYQSKKVDWVKLPEKIKLKPEKIEEMKRLMAMGFDHLTIIPANLVGRPEIKDGAIVKQAEHYADLHEIMTAGYNKTWLSDNYKKEGGIGGAEDRITGLRIILSKEAQDLEDDELLAQTLGKSVDDLNDPTTGIFPKTKTGGFTESGYLILQREYFERTGKHLDEKGYTWLPGSVRPVSGRVANSHWIGGSSQLDFVAYSSDDHYDFLGCRLAGSFETEI